MPRKFQNVRQNFAKGVLSPRLSARVDLEGFKNALKTARNFLISSQGGAVYREGMQHVGYAAGNEKFRIFQFFRGGEIDDILVEVGVGIIRFWIDNGTPALYEDNVTILQDEDDQQLLTDEDDGEFLTVGAVIASNPYTLEDLDDLYFVNQDKYGIIFSANHPPLYITFRADGSVVTELLPVERIPMFAYNDVNSPQLFSEAGEWLVTFPETWGNYPYQYYCLYNGIPSGILTYDFTTPANNQTIMQNGLLAAAAKQGYGTAFSVVNVAGTDSYTVSVSGDNSGYSVVVQPVVGFVLGGYYPVPPLSQVADGGDAVEELAWSYPTWVTNGGNYYRCLRTHKAISAENQPGVGTEWEVYWEDLSIAKPAGFDYQYPSGNAWADTTVYGTGDRGFPTVGAFYQQRLIAMANKDNPTAIYGSEIGAFQNFTPGPNDDQAFIFVLDSSDSPQIKWAVSGDDLVLGTSSGEWVISSEVTLTPTDIRAVRQNAARSKLARPVEIDKEVFYIEQGGRKLRSTHYMRENFGWTSVNFSILMENLLEGGIKYLCVQHVPELLITMVRNDGAAVLFAYERINSVVAGTELITDGTIYDAASYFSAGTSRDYTYFSVQRNGNWVLERMRYPCSSVCTPLTTNGIVYMDGWISGTMPANGIITGLQHFEGRTVSLLVDDAWQTGEYIVTNGQLVTGKSSGTYAVGLVYEGTLETMEVEDNFQGTGLGTKRRWNELKMRLLNSALPLVFNQRDRDRTPSTPMGTSENVRPGLHDHKVTQAGYGDGSIVVIQDRPYPTHVIAFYGEYQVEDR